MSIERIPSTPIPVDTEAALLALPAEEVSDVAAVASPHGTHAEDAALVADAERLIRELAADPLMAVQVAQTWLRDLGAEIREDGALSAQDRAELDSRMAELAREAERAARAAAADSANIGNILGWIGTGIAVAVSVVTSVFTGGASLALGIAAVACMLAAQTVSVLGKEGIIDDPMVAQGVSLGLSVLSAVFSFGATSAGSAAQAGAAGSSLAAQLIAETALQTASKVGDAIKLSLDLASASVGVANGIASIETAVHGHDGDIARIDAERSDMHADDERSEVDENVDGLGAVMRQARRLADLLAGAREARSEGNRAALIRA